MISALTLSSFAAGWLLLSPAVTTCQKAAPDQVAGLLEASGTSPKNREHLLQLVREHGALGSSFDPCRRPLAAASLSALIDGDPLEEILFFALKEELLLPEESKFALLQSAQSSTLAGTEPSQMPAPPSPPPTRSQADLFRSWNRSCEQDLSACRAQSARLYAGAIRADLAAFAERVIARSFSQAPRSERLALDGEPEMFALRRGISPRPKVQYVLSALRAGGFDVFVLSELPDWQLLPLADRLGIDRGRLLGVRVFEDRAGRLSSQIRPPVPAGAGQVLSLRTRIPPGGRIPVVTIGTLPLDRHLLLEASAAALLIDLEKSGQEDGSATEQAAFARAHGFWIEPSGSFAPVKRRGR